MDFSTPKLSMHLGIMGVLLLHFHTLLAQLQNVFEPSHALSIFMTYFSCLAPNLIVSTTYVHKVKVVTLKIMAI